MAAFLCYFRARPRRGPTVPVATLTYRGEKMQVPASLATLAILASTAPWADYDPALDALSRDLEKKYGK
jgi:hypothetical protein